MSIRYWNVDWNIENDTISKKIYTDMSLGKITLGGSTISSSVELYSQNS